MVWTCRAQHRLDCRSTQAECGCTEKIWQAKEIMGWSAWEWQKEATYGFCWHSKSFRVERMPSRKTCQKAQPSVEENMALKWIWWWWWWWCGSFGDNLGIIFIFLHKHMLWQFIRMTLKGGSNEYPQHLSYLMRLCYISSSVNSFLKRACTAI